MQKTPTTIGSSTYQKIKRDIIFGELRPGAKLKLDSLKQRYATSPSTLRETLSRLASEGFVEAPEQRGFRVTPVSNEDLIEIGNLRVLLECHALTLSIENGDTDWEGNLVAAHHKLHLMEQKMLSGDESEKEAWKRYDWEFHLAMIEACNNRNLLSLHAIMYDKYLRYQMLVLTYRGEEAVEEHRVMFEAALARDTKAATTMLERHISSGVAHTLAAMT
ncbi:FCD domain-containing protein [Roseibium album]|uniref:FCD domain-containing protein n=1 Tax=Roseibium album TaxID=311410 RepID=UPI000CF0D6AA|nr:DNA-binding GntR family transcriptional regulator [Labrenzia sp. EL_142]MBG6156860.1 DNA-binding GntR family transcriptional regulator [Labrenzia sp. EL_162]MBG6195200.1 DNA-binding GntR family transcriptional regulator [Labrenzia sp. EL_159]MBG6209748.1 DNA-binding GntR family transcriptional regulator [Labrenzia sp. EL_126]